MRQRALKGLTTVLVGLILVASNSLGLAQVAKTAEPATLRALLASALATHETIARAASTVRRSETDLRLTSAALLPRFDLNGSYTRYAEEQVAEFAPGELLVLRPLANWNWSADLRQTLFYGLRDWRARDVARLRRDVARLEQKTARANLTLEIAHAFFEVVAAEQRLAVRRATHEQAAAQLHVAERRFAVGEVAGADVARWQAQAAAEQARVVAAEGALELGRRRLARLAGVPRIAQLQPPGPVPAPSGSSEELVAIAFSQRLELAALKHQLEAAGLMTRIEKGAWLPEVEAVAQYFQPKSQLMSADSFSLSLTLRVPIYDGGVTAARVAQAREDLLEVELVIREVSKAITDQVETAAIRHRSAVASHQAAGLRQRAAREAHRQVEQAYRVGEASATDLLSTTTELSDAETALVIARWQRELEAIALRHAVGQAPLPGFEPGPRQTEEEPS